MKVYVINMERSIARRKSMELQLKKLGVSYEIVPAVDGRSMTDEDCYNLQMNPGEHTKSQIGCMLSHCKVYSKMQENNDEFALVLEDDVLINEKKFKDLLSEIVSKSDPEKITVLTYFWCRDNSLMLNKSGTTIKGNTQTYSICTPDDVHGIGRAAAYILTKQVAKKLFDFNSPKVVCHADSWIVYFLNGLTKGVDCIYPMPVVENPQFGSEIGYTKNKMEAVMKKIIDKALEYNIPVISNIVKRKRINFAKNYKNIVVKQ